MFSLSTTLHATLSVGDVGSRHSWFVHMYTPTATVHEHFANLQWSCMQEPVSGRKRKQQENTIDDIDQTVLSRLDKLQHQDGEGAFGEHVAACL